MLLDTRLTRNGYASIERHAPNGFYTVTRLPNGGSYYQTRTFDTGREAWHYYYAAIKYDN